MSNVLDERVVDEVEALKAILEDELTVKSNECGQPESVETVVYPATAANAHEQYVRLTIIVNFPSGYPDVPPRVELRNPRGLDDELVTQLEQQVEDKCQMFRGLPVVYELIELIKENLTASNLPSCQCTICLYGFREGDHFTKTHCYHYFHSFCLASLIRNYEQSFAEEQEKLPAWQRTRPGENKILCPVCREPIAYDMELLSNAETPIEVQSARHFELNDELRNLQQHMADLYIYQKEKGGIIDLDAEDSKLLLLTAVPEPNDDPPGPSLYHTSNATRSQHFYHGNQGYDNSSPRSVDGQNSDQGHPRGYIGSRSWRRGRGNFRGRRQNRQSQPASSR